MAPYEPVPHHVDAVVHPALPAPHMDVVAHHHDGHPRRGLLEILWRRSLIVILVALLSAAGGYVYLRQVTPTYQAKARIYVQQGGPKVMSNDDVGWARSINLNNECQVMGSGRVLASALDSPGIRDLRTFAGAPEAFGVLSAGLGIAPGKNDDLITVSFESPYREDVAPVVNAIVNAYTAHKDEQKKGTAAEVLKILRSEKVKRDSEVEANLKGLLDFKQRHGELGFEGEKGNVIILRLERLSNALTEAELQLTEAKSIHDAVMVLKDDPARVRQFLETRRAVSGVFINLEDEDARLQSELAALEWRLRAAKRQHATSQPARPAGGVAVNPEGAGDRLQLELAELEQRLRAAKRQYTANHPDPAVKAIEDEIAIKKKMIEEREATFAKAIEDEIAARKKIIAEREATLVERQVAAVKAQYAAAQERLATTKAAYEEQLKEALKLNATLAEHAKLEYALEQSRKIAGLLDSRIKELNVTQDVGAMNISVLEPARMPDDPVGPNKVRIMGTAVALGLLLGVGLALLRDRMDPRLRSAAEVSAALGVPVVGALPRMKGGKGLVSRGQRILQAPQSPDAEAYRNVRTALTFGMPPDSRARSILVTSPAASEGKSTLISNLAISMAQAGQHTLIIDADLRQPHQHEIFGLDNERGLADALANGTAWEDVIQRTGTDGLDVLPAGTVSQSPTDALNSRKFANVMRDLAGRYDQILIDSPPVLCASDALILAALCDTTLLIVRAEQSHRKIAEQAREGLAGVGARVFGAIINAVPRKKARYGYYASTYTNGNGRRGNGSRPTAIVKRSVHVPEA